MEKIINTRIKQHMTQDKKKLLKYSTDEYIPYRDIVDLINKQNSTCTFCDEELNFEPTHSTNKRDVNAFSIDRINNSLPHTVKNCVLSCFFCNANRQFFANGAKDILKKHKHMDRKEIICTKFNKYASWNKF